jgi:TolB protein
LLLCLALLLGGGIYYAGEEVMTALSLVSPTPVSTPTEAAATPTPVSDQPSPTATSEATATATTVAEATEAEPTETEAVAAEPEIGEITFALAATEDYEPIEPGVTFSQGITEVHAIFEYNGFSPSQTWRRVWYLDGQEVLNSEEAWAGADQGVFDYFVNAGGEPLSAGEWLLELYVGGDLLASGGFVIEAEVEPTEAASPTPVATPTLAAAAAALTPTPRPATPVPAATPTPRPAQTYPLVYTKWDGGKHNLYVSDTNGGSEQFVISRAAGPSWTPDGQYIFFYGEEAVDRQEINGNQYVFADIANGIIRMNAAPVPKNIDQVRLYQGPGWNDGTARWTNVSPNGQMVAYDARPGGNWRVYFLGTDENQQFKFELIGEQADWAPDSQKLAYRSGRDGKFGIWVSNRDDSGHLQITSNGSDSFPAWSPDGRTIVFSRDEGGNVDLYAVNPDGSNLRRLTEAVGPDSLPTFTPEGQIIFRSARSGAWGIWKMNTDGSNPQQIIQNAPVGPDWSFSRMDVGQ